MASTSSSSTTAPPPPPLLSPEEHARLAKEASLHLRQTSLHERNEGILELKQCFLTHVKEIYERNVHDVQLHPQHQQRLTLIPNFNDLDKFMQCMKGMDQVVQLPDPLNRVTLATELDSGLNLYRVTCPLGVLLIIFEARPEVYIQLVTLAIKSGNALILKGGQEAHFTLTYLHQLYLTTHLALKFPHLIHCFTHREDVVTWLHLPSSLIDLVIPRGSKSLVNFVQQNTSLPILAHHEGICCIYIHSDANVESSVEVILDAKLTYPAACNSVETILLHSQWPGTLKLIEALLKHSVYLHIDKSMEPEVLSISSSSLPKEKEPLTSFSSSFSTTSSSLYSLNTTQTFQTEFSSLQVCLHEVTNLNEAFHHIETYGSHHTDSILTSTPSIAYAFLNRIDSANVFWNCSTRFSDGYRYGFGAEVGISTNRIHARGPVGLEGLTIYKYMLLSPHQMNLVSPYTAMMSPSTTTSLNNKEEVKDQHAPSSIVKQFRHQLIPLKEPCFFSTVFQHDLPSPSQSLPQQEPPTKDKN